MRVGTPAEAREAVEAYLAPYPELRVAEVMEFSNHFYAEVEEKETGIGAMELLVWRDGRVTPEPGPNMMWNQKYGHRGMMGGGMMGFQPWGAVSPAQMPIRPEKAREIARQYLVGVMPGAEAGEPEPFYGYYTLHVLRSGKIIGMLSVNGYSGAVWYHSWHGEFLGMEEGHDE
jgi:hypothetical protein